MLQLPIPEPILFAALQRTFGSRCYPVSGKPLTDGTRKKVWLFNLKGAGPRQLVLLVWHNERDYFDEQSDPNNPLNDNNAPGLYRANTQLLLSHGLSVPGIYAFEAARETVPHAFALVEYMEVKTFTQYSAGKTAADTEKIYGKMRDFLGNLHAITREYPGSVLQQSPGDDNCPDCPDQAMTDALSALDRLVKVNQGIERNAGAIRERLIALRSQMAPRNHFTFIHGELGPDEHFLIDRRGQIVILDVDGCQFGDLEREHAYLKLRFPAYELAFRRPDLDPARMDLYGLCLHLLAASGHYRLLMKGYPGADTLREIYEWNAEQVVRQVTEQPGSEAE